MSFAVDKPRRRDRKSQFRRRPLQTSKAVWGLRDKCLRNRRTWSFRRWVVAGRDGLGQAAATVAQARFRLPVRSAAAALGLVV